MCIGRGEYCQPLKNIHIRDIAFIRDTTRILLLHIIIIMTPHLQRTYPHSHAALIDFSIDIDKYYENNILWLCKVRQWIKQIFVSDLFIAFVLIKQV